MTELDKINKEISKLVSKQRELVEVNENTNKELIAKAEWAIGQEFNFNLNWYGPYGYVLYELTPLFKLPEYISSVLLVKTITLRGNDANYLENITLVRGFGHLEGPTIQTANYKLMAGFIKEVGIKINLRKSLTDFIKFWDLINE